ncbi:MAG TPA: UDP-N-acetylmuramoyl-L-alanine--D-glutamate ligase [Actinomycetota bacterium]|nr:UDP-N-acetylmuramoyl-L-alanine--D-glutamate ligase [Actinomycetota bacterium]
MSERFDGRRVLVVGAGVAGRAAATIYADRGAVVRVSDARDAGAIGDVSDLAGAGVEVRTGGHADDDLDGVDLVFASPGVPPGAPPLVSARARGLDVVGELELGAQLASAPYLAVTGTNGKTTATGLLAACLRADGLDAIACGNIGYPFPTAAIEAHDVLVVECSSFQLERQRSFHPRVSVLLNVAPDHLDWHGGFDAYADAKAKVFASQRGDDVHVGNRDDEAGAAISATAPCATCWFRAGAPGAGEVGYRGDRLVARIGDEVDLGAVDAARAGFREDAAAAATAALAFGAAADAIAMGIAAFEPARHRGETVAVVDGVRFVDNSKATNVHAAIAAIDGVTDAVLIAGGRAKGTDLSSLASRADRLRAVVALGEATEELVAAFGDRLPVRRAATIEDAVRVAHRLAAPGGTVLLAPAAASWDQFASYEERGDRFTAAARSLPAGADARG